MSRTLTAAELMTVARIIARHHRGTACAITAQYAADMVRAGGGDRDGFGAPLAYFAAPYGGMLSGRGWMDRWRDIGEEISRQIGRPVYWESENAELMVLYPAGGAL